MLNRDQQADGLGLGSPYGERKNPLASGIGPSSFRAICDAAPVGLALIGPDLRFVWLNQRLAAMTGRSVDACVGRPLAEVTPGIAGQFIPAVQRTLRGETVASIEFQATQPGSFCEGRVFLNSLQPLPDPHGGVAGVLCSALDVTELKSAELALRASEARFRGTFDQAAIGIAHIAFDGRWIWVNARFCDMLGYGTDELLATTLVDVTLPEDLQAVWQHANGLRLGQIPTVRLERRLVRKDGGLLIAQLTVFLLRDALGVPQNFVAFVEDISARKQAEAALAASESRLTRAMTVGRMAAWEWDVANDRLYGSADLEALFARPLGTIHSATSALEVVHADDRLAVATAVERALRNGTTGDHEVEFRVPWPDGTQRWLYARGRAENQGTDKPLRLVGVTCDITERKLNEARITWLAHYDPLTRLANRTLFRQRLDEVLAGLEGSGEMVALHWMDFDQFKCINDTLGHPAGDALLREAAGRLQRCIPLADLAARVGGDEFAIIQTGIRSPADAERLARRIMDALTDPYEIEGRQLSGGASIGIALVPRDGRDPDEIIKKADIALYRAKADGGGSVRMFAPAMDAAVRRRQEMTARLRRALAEDELRLHFQPLVSLRTGDVTCVEALLRWHDAGQLIGPTPEFISSAEEAGLIVPLGVWVLRTACREAMRWPVPHRVAVNISPVQFRHPGLLKAVTAALEESGLPPDRLELEITETVLLEHDQANLAILYQLRALGVRVVLDDFGTGYSSLRYLQRFPFDKLKIDRSFVSGLPNDPKARAIVRSVIGLGRSLDIAVAAEGVETEAQLECLRSEGCDEVQGYLFSLPVPAERVATVTRRAQLEVAATVQRDDQWPEVPPHQRHGRARRHGDPDSGG